MKVGTRQEKRGNRPSNVYAIANPIVLKNIFSDMNVLEFWEKKMRVCSCGELVMRDWDISDQHTCHSCEQVISTTQMNIPLAVEPDHEDAL